MNTIEKIKRVLLGLIILMVIQGCTKDDSEPEPEDKKVLQVTTSTVSHLGPVEATINGRIAEVGETEITDHGFNFSESADFPAESTTQYALGAKTEAGNFSAIVEGLSPETTYHYQAYAKDSEGEVLGEALSFTTVIPAISGVQPAEGSAGEEVVILGNNFVEGMKIMFGEVEAEIVEISQNNVKVIVPNGLEPTSVVLSATLGESEYTSEVEFLPIVGKWVQVAEFPGQDRDGALGFAFEDKGYVGFGFNNTISQGEIYNDFWEYNSTSDSWKQLSDFPKVINVSEISRTSFVLDGVGYIGIGFTSNEFWQYDIQDDLWLRIADFPSTQTGDVYSFVIDGKAYVGRGGTSDENREFWMYDPLIDQWFLQTTYPGKWSQNAFSNSTDGVGYMGLGSGRQDIWRFTLSTSTWQQMNDFPIINGVNRYPTTFYLNNKLYAGITYGGAGIGWDTNFWQYNEQEDTWRQLSSFPFSPARLSTGAVMVIDGNGYMGLGTDIGSSFYKFTPPSE